MYSPASSTYTAPVTSSQTLLDCLPTEYSTASLTASPQTHLLTIKTCNAPFLLQRCLDSFVPEMPFYMRPVVVDDSKNADLRAENEDIAKSYKAAYFAVSGERSIVAEFSAFLAETKPLGSKDALVSYLHRIVTNYHNPPAEGSWGGVAGAQNVAHLCNVMLFGEQGIAPPDWLSTFIDDDILLPPNGSDIFRMQNIYHNLRSVSVIASNYLHHSPNPIRLTRAGVEYLAEHGDDMSETAIAEEIDSILQRTPIHGLRKAEDSDCLYTTPELTLAFPLGNYSLSSDKAFNLPVPIVGMADVGYCELLQLFEGARQLGVARVPDFAHHRLTRKNGGDAAGRLISLYSQPKKEIDHDPFHAVARDYATRIEGVAAENVTGLEVRLRERKGGMKEQIEYLLNLLNGLINNPRFAAHDNVLIALRDNLESADVFSGKSQSDLDTGFVRGLVAAMRTMHPDLIKAAYRFGAEGRLKQYRSSN